MIESSTKYDIDLNANDNIGDTALHLACFGVQTETVKIILEHWKEFGIKIKAPNNRIFKNNKKENNSAVLTLVCRVCRRRN